MSTPPPAGPTFIVRQAAGRLAAQLQGQPEGTPVLSSVALAGQLHVSRTTVDKAKRFLAEQGVIVKEAGTYRVRPRSPSPGQQPGSPGHVRPLPPTVTKDAP